MTDKVFQIDPDKVFMALAGPDVTAGQLYIAEGNEMRPLTPAEVNLALLTCPAFRDLFKGTK